MKRLIIADILNNNVNGKCVGHYFAVADNYMKIFKGLCDIHVAGGPIYCGRYNENILIKLPYDYISGSSILLKPIRSIINCWSLIRQLKREDIVVMQQSADLAMIIGLALFGKKRHEIYVIQYSNQPMQDPFRRFVYQHFTKKKIRGTICPSKSIGELYGTPYVVVPDYIYTDNHGNEECEKVYDFCMIGRLNRDKGIDEAVDVLKNKNCKVLIAGNADTEEYRDYLIKICKDAPNVELKLEYITDEEFDRFIRISRYCILNYYEEYSRRSSGVVFDVVFRNTPIIGRRCSSLQFVEDESLGLLYDDVRKFDFQSCLKDELVSSYKDSIAFYKKKT